MIEASDVLRKEVFYAHHEKFAGRLLSFSEEGQVITLIGDNACHLQVELITPKIIRFRYVVKPFFPEDFSYAIDPNLEPEDVSFQLSEEADRIVVITELLEVHITKEKFLVHIYDKEKNLISSDEKGFHWESNQQHGGEIVKMSKTAFVGESFYGLGDKSTFQNIRGKRFENWGTDQFGFKQGTDPLYKNINLHYSFHNGKTHGIYFDNSFRTHYDIGRERGDIVSYWAEGGEMDYYYLHGSDLLDVSAQYSKLTGTPEMPPLWALGYQQSRWSYYPESRVREVADKMRAHGIPCDAIYLDIDYMDGFRCFTWNSERFPNPEKMVSDLRQQGFKTVAIIDPGIKIDMNYRVFKEGLEQGHFCKRMDGDYMQGKVWPGECYFPDFTNPGAREWWSGLFGELIGNIGLAGIWNDMNEPAIFDVPSKTFPLDVRHDYDGHPCSHRKAHNVYGMQMARATHEGVKRFAGNKRPLVITRSGFGGMQRYSSTWTGDNLASWEHLYLAHMQTVRLSISGVSFCGSDVGGFIDDPDGELYVRWVQLAVFHPFFRTHSSEDDGSQEPWSFGAKNTALVRDAIKLRYKLLPYMYTCFYQNHKEGKPMLRPVVFNSADVADSNTDEEAFLGDHILFCPVFSKSMRSRNVRLPEGLWYDYEDDLCYDGDNDYTIKAPLTKIPFFVRAGAVIPTFPPMQYVGEYEVETIPLRIYFGKEEVESAFYSDANDGYEYKKGAFRNTTFTTEGSSHHFSLGQCFNEGYQPTFSKYELRICGLSAKELNIEVDGVWVQQYNRISRTIVQFTVDRDFRSVQINF